MRRGAGWAARLRPAFSRAQRRGFGSGLIVGAGAVLRGTIDDYAIVIGNPGLVLRLRFAPDEIERLLSLAWWDWSADRIARARPALVAGDAAAPERA